jgi:A/G-specific adenine glycosylase
MQKRSTYRNRSRSEHSLDTPTCRTTLVRDILCWYSRQRRALPWRNITNPYRVLVSEVMLQQTQVSRVLVKYPEFLRRFPSIKKLAMAKQREVVVAWRGMGYNNRAVRLHRLAKTVVLKYGGTLPSSFEELIALPGIGRYTAHALLASVFRENVPIVDVNVHRLFSRFFWRMKTTADMRPAREIWELAEELVPKRRAYDWNQALMDLGATICTARSPQCSACPVTALCSSKSAMQRIMSPPGKREPMKDGIPNRIYRGRIIEILRQHHGRRRFHPDALGRTIHPEYSAKHRRWLESLLTGLAKDKLIRRSRTGRGNQERIHLA